MTSRKERKDGQGLQDLSQQEQGQGTACIVKESGSEIQGEELGEMASHASEEGLEPIDDRELKKGLNRGGM